MKRAILAVLVLLAAGGIAWGQSPYTWTGGAATDDWTLDANWSGTGTPVSGDTVTFSMTATPFNIPTGTFASVTVTAGTVTLYTGNNLTTTALSVTGGTLAVGANTLTVGSDFTNAGTLSVAGGTVDAGANGITNSGTLLFVFVVSTTSTVTCGDFSSTGTITNNGTSTITASGSVSVSGTFGGTRTYSTIVLQGSGETLTAGTVGLGNLEIDSGGTIDLASNISLYGDLTLTAGILDASPGATDYSVELQGDFAQAGGELNSGGTVTFSGSDDQNFDPTGSTFDTISFSKSGGSVTTSAGFSAATVNTANAAYALTFQASCTVTNLVTFRNTNTLTISDGFVFNGGATATSGAKSLAGTISTSNDDILFGSTNVTLTDLTTISTGSGAIALGGTISGAFALELDSTGTTTLAGTVDVASLTTDASGTTAINGGTVETSGDQTYNDNVTLGANTTMSGDTITFGGTLGNGTSRTLDITGAAVFNGLVGNGTALTRLTVSSDATINTTSIRTTGLQTYSGDVTLSQGVTLTSTTNGNVTFFGTVNGTQTLSVGNGSGTVTFVGTVGNTDPLSSLSVTSTSSAIAINTTQVSTSGAQSYSGTVTLGANAVLSSSGDDAVTFAAVTADASASSRTLEVDTDGLTTFGGAVGATALYSLTTDSGGTLAINGGSVTTTAGQTYGDAVTLGADTTLTGTTVTFGSTVNGATHDLTLAMSAAVSLDLDDISNVQDFTKNGGGNVTVLGTLTTSATQTWTNAVILSGATVLDGTTVSFGSTIGNTSSQTLEVDGATTFAGTVGSGTPLTSLAVYGTVGINTSATTITTTGLQYYSGAVTLGVSSTLVSTGDDITFASSVGQSGSRTLTLQNASSTGDVYLSGAVTLNGLAFGSGTTACDVYMTGTGSTIGTLVEFVNQGALILGQAGGTITFGGGLETTGNTTNPTSVSIYGSIVTTSDAIYLGAVTLSANTVLDTGGSGAGTVTLGTVSGAYRLEIRGILSTSATLTATYLRIITSGAIGASGTPLSIDVDYFEASAGGLINVSNNGSVQIGFTGGTFSVTGVSTTSGDITLIADDFTVTEAIDGSAALTMYPRLDSTAVVLGDDGGDFSLNDAEILLLNDGFTLITLGRADSGTVTVTGAAFTDPVTILGGDDITINGLSTSAANAAITVTGSGSTTDIAITGAVAAGSGAITMTTGGSVSLGASVTTSGTATLTATAGSITDATAAEGTLLSANLADLTAATGIGTSAANGDIDTAVTTLCAEVTGSGDIYVGDTDAITLGNGTDGVIAANGVIDIRGTAIALTNDVTSTTSGLITLAASSGAITRTGGTVTSASGVLALSASTYIGANGAALQTDVATLRATASNGGIYVTESTGLALGDGSGDISAVAGNIVISAAGNVDTGNTITTTTSGNITLTTTSSGTMVIDQTLTAATTTATTGITLTNADQLTLSAVVTAGTGGFTQNGAGDVSLGADVTTGGANSFATAVTLTADGIDVTGSTTTFLGAITGDSHDLYIHGAAVFGNQTTDTVTELSALTVSGATTVNTTTITTTTGGQLYSGAVTLGTDVAFTGDASTLVRFGSTLDGGTAGHSATITDADAQFDGVVGGASGGTTNVLTALSVDGASAINTTTVTTTTGGQTFIGAVTLGTNVLFSGNSSTLVRFESTLGGGATGRSVEINNANARFDDAVGGAANLVTSLIVDGSTSIYAASITTGSTQTYSGAVTLYANTVLTSVGAMQFGSTLNGSYTLELNAGTTGAISVNGDAGLVSALGALTISQSYGTTFAGALSAVSLTVSDTQAGRTVSIAGILTLTTGNLLAEDAGNAYNVSLTGPLTTGSANSVAGTATFSNTGDLTLGDADTDSFTFTGGITATATDTNTFRGTISTGGGSGQDMTFDTFTLAGVTTMDAGSSGDVTLSATTTIAVTDFSGDTDSDLTISAAALTATGITFTVAASSTLDLASSGFSIGAVSNLGVLRMTGQQTTHTFTTFNVDSGTVEYYGTGAASGVFASGLGTTGNAYWDLQISGTGAGVHTLDGNILVYDDVYIASGVLDAGSDCTITVSGDWQNDVGDSGFVPEGGTVTFDKASGTIYVRGDNTWYIFQCVIPGITILFENEMTQTIADGGTFIIRGSGWGSGSQITLNRITDYSPTVPSSVPVNPDEDYLFWFFDLTPPDATLDMQYVEVWYSNARTNPINVPDNVYAWYIDSSNPPPHYDFKWLNKLYALYSYTEDSDYNGKIDRLRIQTEAAVNTTAADAFSGLTIEVEGYTVTGYEAISGNDYNFYVDLQEQNYLDTGATPLWRVTSNTSLTDSATGSKYFGTLETTDTDYMTPGDTAWPVIGYTLAIPQYTRGFVAMSEAVVTAGDATPGATDFGFTGNLTEVTTSGLGISEAEGDIAALTVVTLAGGASDLTLTSTLKDLGSAPVWDSQYDSLAPGAPNPSYPPSTGYTTNPDSYTTADPRPDFEIQRGGNEPNTHRVSDLLISVEPSDTTGSWSVSNPDSYFVWPLWAKDSAYYPEVPASEYTEYTADEASGLYVGFIRSFDGDSWLRDQDFQMQVEAHSSLGLDGGTSPYLLYDSNVDDAYLSATPGIWLPDYTDTDFSGLAGPENLGYSTNTDNAVSGTDLWTYDFEASDAKIFDKAVVDFYFRLPGYTSDLYAGRLDMDTGAADIPTDWYRRVRPFTIDIHDVVTQRGGVTILNNVIDPTSGERTRLHFTISTSGPVTITVFTLDGDVVRSLQRGTMGAGDYTVSWDGRNRSGDAVARGMYFIRIVASGIDEIRKVMVVRY